MNDYMHELMMACYGGGGAASWQEYPVECWGIGNWWTGFQPENYERYANVIYWQAPLLSPSVYVENNSNYNASIRWFDSNMVTSGEVRASTTGEYTAPSGTAYFTVIVWDRPPFSVVDTGLFKIYYYGQPYQYPTQKPIMTGSDYLWCMGNQNSGQLNEAYANCCVRTHQPVQTRLMDVDMTLSQYNITMWLYDSNHSVLDAINFFAGNSYTDVLSSRPTAMYYTITYWDQPTMRTARTAPFRIIFN